MNGRRRNVITNMRSHGLSLPMDMMLHPRSAAGLLKEGKLVRDGSDDYGRPLYRLAPELYAKEFVY